MYFSRFLGPVAIAFETTLPITHLTSRALTSSPFSFFLLRSPLSPRAPYRRVEKRQTGRCSFLEEKCGIQLFKGLLGLGGFQRDEGTLRCKTSREMLFSGIRYEENERWKSKRESGIAGREESVIEIWERIPLGFVLLRVLFSPYTYIHIIVCYPDTLVSLEIYRFSGRR